MEHPGLIPSAPPCGTGGAQEVPDGRAGQASETRAHRAAGPGLPALPPDVRASLRAGSARPALLAAVTGGVNWDSQGTTTSKTYPQGPRPLISKTQSRSSFCGGMDRRARKFMNWGRGRERSRYGCVRVLVLLVTLWQLGRARPAAGPASPRRIGKAGRSLNGAPLAASGPAAWGGGTAAPRPPCPVPGEASHPCGWPPAPPTQRASESIRSRCFAGTYYVLSSVWGDQMDETKWWSVFRGALCGVPKEDLARCRMQGEAHGVGAAARDHLLSRDQSRLPWSLTYPVWVQSWTHCGF